MDQEDFHRKSLIKKWKPRPPEYLAGAASLSYAKLAAFTGFYCQSVAYSVAKKYNESHQRDGLTR